MSQRHLNDADGLNHGDGAGSIITAPYEYAAVYEYLGKNRYLQAAFCKSVRKLYSDMFGMYTTKALSNIAAEEGFPVFLEWSKEIGCRWNETLYLSGAKGGHVNILEFLKDNDCPMTDSSAAAWTAAARRGHLEVLRFAYESNYLGDLQDCCEAAADKGQLKILKWVHEVEGVSHFNAFTCELAAMGGFIELIQWLHSVGCAWSEDICWAAIEHGHLCIVKWALDNGCSWTVNDSRYNGRTGLHYARNVEVIEFLISMGAQINAADRFERTPVYSAAEDGKVEAVITLVRAGADVNIAKRGGHTPLDVSIIRGHLDIVEVLRAAGARD